MMTAEQEIADALCELKTIRADYRAMSEAWRRDKRAIIDICVAHADIRTLQAILDHLEKSCDWTRWPAEPPGLRAGAVAWAIGLREQMFGAKQQIRGRGARRLRGSPQGAKARVRSNGKHLEVYRARGEPERGCQDAISRARPARTPDTDGDRPG